jgi:site-specific DNA recombinase
VPKVALYARYSTDNQSVVSIEDQLRICREHAGRERWQVVDTYHDAAISGARVILRPGVQLLLQDAQHGRFDIVLAEALDRVSRDQADVATLFKHLRFAGVQIVTLAEGEISELYVGLSLTQKAGPVARNSRLCWPCSEKICRVSLSPRKPPRPLSPNGGLGVRRFLSNHIARRL